MKFYPFKSLLISNFAALKGILHKKIFVGKSYIFVSSDRCGMADFGQRIL